MSKHFICNIVTRQEIELFDWRILQTSAGTCHFVGCRTHGRGRVSSEIKGFDRGELQGTTRSGNLYRLEGPSRSSVAADAVWRQWCTKNGVETWNDVTSEWLSRAVREADEPSTRDARAYFNGDPQQ
jgi:hypothetical protein